MMSVEEIERHRRSAAMAPLTPRVVDEILEACAEMARERRELAAALAELRQPFGDVRDVLNRLTRMLG